MSYAIYALRKAGDCEPRYIGFTSHSLERRMYGHFHLAKRMPVPTAFASWLNTNEIEAFELDVADTEIAARRVEREFVLVCVKLGHRLFNTHHVPREHQLNRRVRTPWASAA